MKKNFQQFADAAGNIALRVSSGATTVGGAAKAHAVSASTASGELARSAASGLQSGYTQAKSGVADAARTAEKAARVVGGVAGAVGTSAVRTVSTIGTTLLDQNGDGELDQQDVKLATEKTASAVKAAVSHVASSDLAKDAAAGAAIGAVIAIPIPLVGPLFGAALGAVVGSISNLRRRK